MCVRTVGNAGKQPATQMFYRLKKLCQDDEGRKWDTIMNLIFAFRLLKLFCINYIYNYVFKYFGTTKLV